MFDLSEQVAVITGGGKGIGQSIAEVFAKQGSEVHILEIDRASGQETQMKIEQAGGQASVHACDISQQAEVVAVAERIFQQSGSIDIWVNNAGIAHIGNVESTTEEDFDRIYAVNIKGVYNGMRACVPLMKQQKGGVILNLASVASVLGISDRFAYSTSKGAVLTMTLSVAKDYVKDNIRCNCIGPGRVHTPFVDGFLEKNYPGQEAEMFEKLSQTQPIGRMGKPEEIAHLALYLCSQEAGFITGSFYPIDGGFITLNS
ncbi:SDR family NAD(P)-dependent oxidoreductase [Tunicatimonas pelagia]|uniref:SDR family NAD(P)-dependent oxidoreductase n=1 Tax=Tunicatimonas pelagia TaxID=931531 RepID=UPI0026670449|nr:SDR family oxidoreductase [Tunicatimonas pelagia]WKN46389.1 SDR family NAD(P)-dependent oxidoreductase [Tunicatimonas pelagia]